MADFDKQIKGIFNTVRSTINPDYAIPKDHENAPINIRIKRMKESAEMLDAKLKEISGALSAFTTNLNALTEEVQPYIEKEASSPVAPTDATTQAPSEGEKPAEKTGDVDPTSEEVVTEDKAADSAEKPAEEEKK